MRKFHAMIWVGVAVMAAGAFRLIAPFSASIGTIRTSCGNAIAYLDNQDKQATFAATLSICQHALQLASLEGCILVVVGLVLFIIGLVVVQRHRRAFREHRSQRRARRMQHQSGFGGSNAETAGANVGGATVNAAAMQNPEVYEQFMRLGRLTRPRTVLSFFGIVFAALIAGSVVAISLFLKNPTLSHDIPWILAFDAVVAIVLIIGVFVTITKDPARLMLSEISNQNAVALRSSRRSDDPPPGSIPARRVDDPQNPSQFRRRATDQRD